MKADSSRASAERWARAAAVERIRVLRGREAGDRARTREVGSTTRTSQAAGAAFLRAEKDLAKSGDKHRREESASATTAAEAPYFLGSSAAVATGAPCTAAGPYPAAGAAVSPPTDLGAAYFSAAPSAVGAPSTEAGTHPDAATRNFL